MIRLVVYWGPYWRAPISGSPHSSRSRFLVEGLGSRGRPVVLFTYISQAIDEGRRSCRHMEFQA